MDARKKCDEEDATRRRVSVALACLSEVCAQWTLFSRTEAMECSYITRGAYVLIDERPSLIYWGKSNCHIPQQIKSALLAKPSAVYVCIMEPHPGVDPLRLKHAAKDLLIPQFRSRLKMVADIPKIIGNRRPVRWDDA